MNRLALLGWIALSFLLNPALEASELAILGLYQQSAPFGEIAGNGYGAGFQFSAAIYKRIELELGASYTQRSWNDPNSGNLLMPAIDIPVGFRLRLFRFWAFDAGGYYSSINGGSRVSTITTVDWGVYGGIQLMIPLSSKGALFLGGRYLYGLANIAQPGAQLTFRTFQAMAGYQFNLSSN